VQKGHRVKLLCEKNNAYGADRSGRSPVQRHTVTFYLAVSILTFTGDARGVKHRAAMYVAQIFICFTLKSQS